MRKKLTNGAHYDVNFQLLLEVSLKNQLKGQSSGIASYRQHLHDVQDNNCTYLVDAQVVEIRADPHHCCSVIVVMVSK